MNSSAASQGEALVKANTVRSMLKVGQLVPLPRPPSVPHPRLRQVDVNWRVGVALESSLCEDLKEPYVTLQFQVASSDDAPVENRTVELTIPQFHEVAAQFKEMERLLDMA